MIRLIIIENEKFLNRYVELVGRERQYFSVIAVLFFSAYLCGMLFYLCYSTGDYYCGCHCCDLIWMPHLGNISEFTLFCIKKNVHFQNFFYQKIRDCVNLLLLLRCIRESFR